MKKYIMEEVLVWLIIVLTFKNLHGVVKMLLLEVHSVNLKIILQVCIRNSCSYDDNKYLIFIEPEKNFALEYYGNSSMCFDHSQDMWEERSCHQTREWQHWGSGCYEYKCEQGRLHIMVSIILKYITCGL